MQNLSDFDLLPATKLKKNKIIRPNKIMHKEAIEKIWFCFKKFFLIT